MKPGRTLSNRGYRTGKDGQWIGAAIGLATTIGGAILGGRKKKKAEQRAAAEEAEMYNRQGMQAQEQSEFMDDQQSDSILAQYDPQGHDQVYAKHGAAIPAGSNMMDSLRSTSYEEMASYQNGGSTQVPGGQIQQVSDRAQVVRGDNPDMIDDVELGTNPGEPDAVVDHNEVMIDAIDEQGQPYKQIFSDTVLVPGKSKSMAKEAKKLLKQMPKDEESEQAQHLYKKLDDLFNTQQMLNGDSHGENSGEASAGGMDPMAAQEMGMQGEQAFMGGGGLQYGGADYYNEGMREEMMQVPYPNKNNMQLGGAANSGDSKADARSSYIQEQSNTLDDNSLMDLSRRIMVQDIKRKFGGEDDFSKSTFTGKFQDRFPDDLDRQNPDSVRHFMSNYQEVPRLEEASTPGFKGGGMATAWNNFSGGNNASGVANALNAGVSGLASGMGIGYSLSGENKNLAGGLGLGAQSLSHLTNELGNESEELEQIEMAKDSQEGINNQLEATQDAVSGEQYGGKVYEDGGMAYDNPMNMQDMYSEAKSFMDYYEEREMPNSLLDMQSHAGLGYQKVVPDNLGRHHRSEDPSDVISASERGGPSGSKKAMRKSRGFGGRGFSCGGRLRYTSPLNKQSLTLKVQS
jgi:hypothetical protein